MSQTRERERRKFTYLPTGAAIVVTLVLEVGYVLDHPLVDLREGEPLVGRAGDRLGDEIGVAEVPPGVSP